MPHINNRKFNKNMNVHDGPMKLNVTMRLDITTKLDIRYLFIFIKNY